MTVVDEDELLSKIYVIRGERVMIDSDLADLYGVETKYLKRQVKRNIERFPEDFMFELTKKELDDWRCHNGTSNPAVKMGLRYSPYVFTEQGVAQLSSVLNSQRAIQINIQIIRLFTRMRRLLLNEKNLMMEFEKMKRRLSGQDNKIDHLFNYLKAFIQANETPRIEIGFRKKRKNN